MILLPPGLQQTSFDNMRPIIDRLNADLRKVLANPEVAARLAATGMDEPTPSTPEALASLVRSEIAKWRKVVQDAGIRID